MLKSKKALMIAIPFFVCALILAVLFALGIFDSKDVVSASVTYDEDPYNAGQSSPHTYVVTKAEDIAFVETQLLNIERVGGSACPFGQIILHVTYADGGTADYYPACDSCATIAKNDPDNGENHFELPQDALREFRQRISGYIPELTADNWWLKALG